MKNFKKYMLCFLALAMIALNCATGIFAAKDSETKTYNRMSDFENATLGVWMGIGLDDLYKEYFPGATLKYFSTGADLCIALEQGKIDGFLCDSPILEFIQAQRPWLKLLDEYVVGVNFAFMFPKTERGAYLQSEYNAFLTEYKAQGRLDDLKARWFSLDESQQPEFDLSALPNINGEISAASLAETEPMCYVRNGKVVGENIELLYEFCLAKGFAVTLETPTDAAAPVAGIESGKYDVYAANVTITAERAEKYLFGDPFVIGGIGMLTRNPDADTMPEYTDLSDLNGQKLGVQVASGQESWTKERFSDSQLLYFDDFGSIAKALVGHKVEGFIVPDIVYRKIAADMPEITYLPEPIAVTEMAYAFSPERTDLLNQMNEFISVIKENGRLAELTEVWQNGTPEEMSCPDFDSLTGENGTIKAGITPAAEPVSYIYMGKFAGFEIDLLYDFCREYGYALDMENVSFTSLLVGVSTGTYDLAAGTIAYTEERAQTMLLSDTTFYVKHYMAVRKQESSASKSGLWQRIQTGFERNFIREDRWQMVLSGLALTITITLLSAIAGILLGFLLYLLRNTRLRPLSGFMAFYIRFIQGVPVLVLLMVLYYVVFGKTGINAVIVSVMGFSLNFSVSCCEMLYTGIHAVDRGQTDAATALGFSRFETYRKVIFPQAAVTIMPVFKGEFINMLKMTSVVGYIAVQDLTKVTDIIRSRTYDALFPLIVTSLIYFLTAWGLTSLLGFLEVKIDPKKRKNVLKDIAVTDIAPNTAAHTDVEGTPGEPLIEITHLRKTYENATPLADVNATIYRGNIISVIGPSGTGKTTLLRCINRLETPTSGQIRVFGKSVTDKRANLTEMRLHVGMVFQSFNLFSHLTVIENLMLGPVNLLKKDRQSAYNEGMALLARVGLADKALNYPDELSGGQKQRVAIVRALAMHPDVLLFDEPTSALDPTMVGEVLAVIRGLSRQGYTMMIVTHEMKFARNVSNRIFYMDEGGIYEDGTPAQIFDAPQKERTRAFVNRLRLFRYELPNDRFDFVGLSNALDNFGHAQLMTAKTLDGLLHCVEELVMEGLVKTPGVAYPAEVNAEYNEDGEATVTVKYGGKAVNILNTLDDISQKLLYAAVGHCDYRFENDENTVTARLL